MDSNLAQRRRGLEEKIPDIKKTLSMVEFLRDRQVRYLHERGAGYAHLIAPQLSLSLSEQLLSDKGCGGVLSSSSALFQEGNKGATGSDAGDSDDELQDEDEHDGKPVPIKTTFELADTLYAEAELEETDTVYLWLGVRSSRSILVHLF